MKSGDSNDYVRRSSDASERVTARVTSYIPTVAFSTALVFITFSVFAAILGRELVKFPTVVADAQVGDSLDVAGPVMIIGWVAAIFLFGGYRPEVFGAGLDEYDPVINSSFLTAAAVGVGCYLLRFQVSPGSSCSPRPSASRSWSWAGSCCAAASKGPASSARSSTVW